MGQKQSKPGEQSPVLLGRPPSPWNHTTKKQNSFEGGDQLVQGQCAPPPAESALSHHLFLVGSTSGLHVKALEVPYNAFTITKVPLPSAATRLQRSSPQPTPSSPGAGSPATALGMASSTPPPPRPAPGAPSPSPLVPSGAADAAAATAAARGASPEASSPPRRGSPPREEGPPAAVTRPSSVPGEGGAGSAVTGAGPGFSASQLAGLLQPSASAGVTAALRNTLASAAAARAAAAATAPLGPAGAAPGACPRTTSRPPSLSQQPSLLTAVPEAQPLGAAPPSQLPGRGSASPTAAAAAPGADWEAGGTGLVAAAVVSAAAPAAAVQPGSSGAAGSGTAQQQQQVATPAPALPLGPLLAVLEELRAACPWLFLVLWHPAATEDPALRLAAFAAGANMVTCSAADLSTALAGVASQRGLLAQGPQATATATATAAAGAAPASAQATASAAVSSVAAPGSRSSSGPKGAGSGGCGLACEWCGLGGLSVTDYWTHVPLYHTYTPNRPGRCQVCGEAAANLAVHVHEQHGPGGPQPEVRTGAGAVLVVRRPSDGKFLMVQEFAGQGFWLPGGGVDAGEPLSAGAVREAWEEAGVEVELTGLLEAEHKLDHKPLPWRLAVFLAQPKGGSSDNCSVAGGGGGGGASAGSTQPQAAPSTQQHQQGAPVPKTVPCFESAGACWVGLEQLEGLALRNPDLPLKWFPRVARGEYSLTPVDGSGLDAETVAAFAGLRFV